MPRIDHVGEFRDVMNKMPGAFAPGCKVRFTDADGKTTSFTKTPGGTVLSMSSGTPTPLLVKTMNDSSNANDVTEAVRELLARVTAGSAGTIYYDRIREAIASVKGRFATKKRLLTACEKLRKAMLAKRS